MEEKNVLDDDVEVSVKSAEKETRTSDVISYSNANIVHYNFFDVIFSKKFLSITFSIIALFLTLFIKFMAICGVTSRAFHGIFFFIAAGFAFTGTIMNLVKFAKNKKIEFDVATIINIVTLVFLILL